jgi:hypothetical protein
MIPKIQCNTGYCVYSTSPSCSPLTRHIVELSFIPRAIYKNETVRILFIAFARACLNIVMLFSMYVGRVDNDYSKLVIWCWAIGQLLFWLQMTLLAYRFFATNIRSQLMKKATEKVPELEKLKLFYFIIYLLIVAGQVLFVYIAYIPDNVELALTVWNHMILIYCNAADNIYT